MEQDEFLRVAWRVMVQEKVEVSRLVFVDEVGTNTSLSSLYAWALKGQRARWSTPRNRGPNTTLLASINSEGMGPCIAVVGSINAAVFEAYVEEALAPTPAEGLEGGSFAEKIDGYQKMVEEYNAAIQQTAEAKGGWAKGGQV